MMAGYYHIIMAMEDCTACGLGQEVSLTVREGKFCRTYEISQKKQPL